MAAVHSLELELPLQPWENLVLSKELKMRQRQGAYAPDFRQQMVELVRVGRKPVELAKKFGCHETSISAWVRQTQADERRGGRPDSPLTRPECQEFAQLRHQLPQVTLERDILAEASARFANRGGSVYKTSMR
jgi:transposase